MGVDQDFLNQTLVSSTVHVAVAVIINSNNQVLIAKRSATQDQGNKWEFPGGKIEKGETPVDALRREILEEVALDVQSADFLLSIMHEYETKNVQLDIYTVKKWQGEAKGNEGQKIDWVSIDSLDESKFPAANAEIIRILRD